MLPKPKVPTELKALASFLQGKGYTLAIPPLITCESPDISAHTMMRDRRSL